MEFTVEHRDAPFSRRWVRPLRLVLMWRVVVGGLHMGAHMDPHSQQLIQFPCPQCGMHNETLRHVFWNCRYTKSWWDEMIMCTSKVMLQHLF
ncbi:hypothetical protein KP509_10G045600 [Ceratopteris richardii]|uniref:Reverse transcriptase zinc-binding domain-containing protein n=1 Tax=Ceratopteris richardii TaxID=49495 RepID=A0A8T2U1J4_CERRI|nr:hypothetical protein KP509_10G045600 [Ceratopteris richardii]